MAVDAETGKLLLNTTIPNAVWIKFTIPTVVNGQALLGVADGVAVLRVPMA
jgi:hypothetical protein